MSPTRRPCNRFEKVVFDRVRTLAATCGLAAGFPAGEVLTHTKPLGSRDLLQTLLLKSQREFNAEIMKACPFGRVPLLRDNFKPTWPSTFRIRKLNRR